MVKPIFLTSKAALSLGATPKSAEVLKTNKKLKKENTKKLNVELSMLLPGFGYMSYCMSKTSITKARNAELEESENISVLKTWEITQYLGTILFPYKNMHQKAIAKNASVLKRIDTTHINSYLLGLSLIAKHLELKNTVFATSCIGDTIIELQDLAIAELSAEIVSKTFDVADQFLVLLLRDFKIETF